jgi:uncharacterized protein
VARGLSFAHIVSFIYLVRGDDVSHAVRTSRPLAADGSVPTSQRVLAPDLARGFALLLVALAHTAGFVYQNVPGLDHTPHGLERGYSVLLIVFVHACAMPLFVLMFGYGIVQLVSRQDALGTPWPVTRGVLVRRHLGMVAIGALHGIFLFSGDILGAFGLMALVFTLVLLRRGPKVHRFAMAYVVFCVGYVGVLMAMTYAGIGSTPVADLPTDPSPAQSALTYGASLVERVAEWPVITATVFPMILTLWVGAWAARRRVLEEPPRHRRLLVTGAVGGFALAIAGAAPFGLYAGGFVTMDAATAPVARTAYEVSGFFGGIGYACVFGLIGMALSRRTDRVRDNVFLGSVVALGQRTMSGYLFQSVAWLVLLTPFSLDLGQRMGSPALAAVCCAVGVWLLSAAVAYGMHRAGYRGPVEILLRRFAYRRRT